MAVLDSDQVAALDDLWNHMPELGKPKGIANPNLGTELKELQEAAPDGLVTDLAATTSGEGAAMIGVEDSAATITGATVEAALAELSKRLLGVSASETTIKAIAATKRSDGAIVIDATNDVAWVFDAGSAASASAWVLVPDAGTGRWLRNHPSLADLSSTANLKGASLVGIEDSAGRITATTVEASFAEIAGRVLGAAASETAIKAIAAAVRVDGMLIVDLTNDVLWSFDSGSAAGASAWVLVPDAGTGRWLRNQPSLADLIAVTNGKGAALVGIEDTAARYAGATAEAALSEALVKGDLFVIDAVVGAEGAVAANAIEIACTIKDALGATISAARQMKITTRAISDNEGDLAAAGTPVGTTHKSDNPATGANEQWMETTSGGLASFRVTDTAVEIVLVEIQADGCRPRLLKLSFA